VRENVREGLTESLISDYMRVVKIKAHKAVKLCRRPDVDVDDLISEGLLGLLAAIRTYDEEKGGFKAYADVCISNRIKNVAFTEYQGLDDYDFTLTADKQFTDEIVIEEETQREISSGLSEILSGLEFSVFNLYLDSYSYSAIAERLSLPVKTVDNALSRARTKLRRIYG
jgi:RNA polymerase sporulation-specific sigma factor